MLTALLMARMSDSHLVAALHAEFDPLTATAAELELLKRFEALLDEHNSALVEAIEEYDFEAKDITDLGDALIVDATTTVALLKVIGDAGIDAPESLKAELDTAAKFRAVLSDAGDVFTRLSQLTTALEE